MPWHIGKSASCLASKPHAVIQDTNGRVMGCHATRDAAQKQLAALNINAEREALEAVLWELIEAVSPQVFVRALARDQGALTATFEREVARSLSNLGAHVAAVADQIGGLIVEEATPRETSRIAAIIKTTNLEKWAQDAMLGLFTNHYKRVLDITAKTLSKAGLPVTARDEAARAIIITGGQRVGLMDLKASTRHALFAALEHARAEGLGPRDIARTIRTMVPAGRFVNAGAGYRAQLIARTETLHAQRASTLRLYRDSDRVKMVVAYDGDKDELCAPRNGAEFTLADAEIEMARTHPGCVLAFGPVVQ